LISGFLAHSDVSIAGCVFIERVIAHGCVLRARCVRFHGVITKRIIFVAVCIVKKRVTTKRVVEIRQPGAGIVVAKKRKRTDCIVVGGNGITK
jgi:hypothetical protein